jgi:hypothetical protein
MAKVKYGAIVTELKGKMGGQVFQGGNVGYVMRNKGYTPGINSAQRQAANKSLVTSTQGWRSLTDAQRAAWVTGSVNWPFKDKFGNIYYGSGFQFYTAYTTNQRAITGTSDLVPNVPTSSTNPGILTGTYSLSGNLRLSWDNATVMTTALSFFGSAPYGAGKNGKNLNMKFLYNLVSAGDTHIDLNFSYPAQFGFPPVGSYITFRVIVRCLTWPLPTYQQDIRVKVTA